MHIIHEPSLDEIFAEPIVQLLMAADHVNPATAYALCDDLRKRLARRRHDRLKLWADKPAHQGGELAVILEAFIHSVRSRAPKEPIHRAELTEPGGPFRKFRKRLIKR
jgi:hypothetical protein